MKMTAPLYLHPPQRLLEPTNSGIWLLVAFSTVHFESLGKFLKDWELLERNFFQSSIRTHSRTDLFKTLPFLLLHYK